MKNFTKISLVVFFFCAIYSCAGDKKTDKSIDEKVNIEEVSDSNSQSKSEGDSAEDVMSPELSLYFKVQQALSQDDVTALNVLFENPEFESDFTNTFSKSEGIEDKRVVFYEWTKDLTSRLDKEDLPYTVYQYSCPMAFDFTSATWLSLEKAVRNPYFGESMLKCGSLKSEF
jgi:hypothetical protein